MFRFAFVLLSLIFASQVFAGRTIVYVGVSNFPLPIRAFHDNQLAVPGVLIESDFFGTYSENARHLNKEFLRIWKASGKSPLTIIGNPQSGPDSLYAVLKNPALIDKGVVRELVLLTPAFGSPLADGNLTQELMGEVSKIFGRNLRKFETKRTLQLFTDGLNKLSTSQFKTLDKKLFYVRGSTDLQNMTPYLMAPYLFMRKLGETDGISYTSDQMLPGIGQDLGVMKVDHWDLFGSFPMSNSPASFRKNFMKELLQKLK